jgi:hypothetical protein
VERKKTKNANILSQQLCDAVGKGVFANSFKNKVLAKVVAVKK